jgi:MFS family permease
VTSSAEEPPSAAQHPQPRSPRLGRDLPATFWWLWTGWLVSALANFVFPFLAFFLARRGVPPAQAGLLVSAFGAGSVVAGPCAGFLADRIGRKPTILVSLIASGAAAATVAFLTSPFAIGAAILLFGLSSQAVNTPW